MTEISTVVIFRDTTNGMEYGVRKIDGEYCLVIRGPEGWCDLPGKSIRNRNIRNTATQLLHQLSKNSPDTLKHLQPTDSKAYGAYKDVAALQVLKGLEALVDEELIYVEDDPPDAIFVPKRIGIELTEWLDPRETEDDFVRMQFEAEVRASLGPLRKELNGFGVYSLHIQAEPLKGPNGRFVFPSKGVARQRLISDLLAFVREESATHYQEWMNPFTGPHATFPYYPRQALPSVLSNYFVAITIHPIAGLGIEACLDIGGAYSPTVAFDALVHRVDDKTLRESDYNNAKSRHGLSSLWLVVHRFQAEWANTPIHGFNIEQGVPELEEEVALREKLLDHLKKRGGAGAFEAVYLVFTHDGRVEQVWP